MVYALVRLKFGELVRQDSLGVVPVDIPVSCFIVSELIPKLFNSLLDDAVPALTRAEQQVLWLYRFLLLLECELLIIFTLVLRRITALGLRIF